MSLAGVGAAVRIHRRTYASVDLAAIQSNFRLLRDAIPQGAFVCPMVKADAYGHGDVAVARALRDAGALHLGVALIEEAVRLREKGDRGSLLFFGVNDDESSQELLDRSITLVASEWHQLHSLAAALKRNPLATAKAHVNFNTGMNRLGFSPDEGGKLRDWFAENPNLELEGLCTHLLQGEDAGEADGETARQLSAFAKALEAFRGVKVLAHVMNSAAVAGMWRKVLDESHFGESAKSFWPIGSRPGIGIYGVQSGAKSGAKPPLKPALSFRSHIAALHRLQPGEATSYNARWRAQRSSLVGVVPAGYADGYFRNLTNKGQVLVRGKRAPVVGTVCMDYFMVDLTDVAGATGGEIEAGEEVVMIGGQNGAVITAEEVAEWAGTIAYEILTRIGPRVPRVYNRGPS